MSSQDPPNGLNIKDVPGSVAVIMVPLPAQGHLNQLLQLAHLVSSYGVPVHYVGSATHNRQAKLRSHVPPSSAPGDIRFHDFPTPPIPSPAPSLSSPHKFPSHLQPAFDAALSLRSPVASFVQSLSSGSRRVVVVHDSLMASVVQDAASVPNAEIYEFKTISAFTLCSFKWERIDGAPPEVELDIAELISSKGFPSIQDSSTDEFLKFRASQKECKKLNSGCIYNTCRVVEGRFVDLYASATANGTATKHWAIGPFNPVKVPEKTSTRSAHWCMEWLDKQAPSSVIYVSFGTTTALSDEQIREIAMGLERSGQKFIWVLREADKADIFGGGGEARIIELPQGFEEMAAARDLGVVVRDWAPQLEILGHPATGGFLSHCGWNSCMESISMGVPILAWPMHSDQPRNAVLITRVLKIGLIVKDWMSQDDVVKSSIIEGAVKALMVTEEGEEARKRAAELGAAVRGSMDEGGVSRAELDSFIAHIAR
ncbi:LOW QUALITY PROTEIN: zeatin O-glucosyltransferase [Eucalyptus grandis]|uniref:LOW QUALITY PROTEIN: zeatin O-glucosyltransferase n=1 Tax=Eucalyptus grandis TaxID=71139 RepID=UPI00192E95F2|nr:LOW QUALITY PROTEIN: zeatin O-glucosyltransferase [Eucalyptus grandis]